MAAEPAPGADAGVRDASRALPADAGAASGAGPRAGAGPAWGANALAIGGYEPFSTVDWPGKLAATVFLQGCPWRCAYCHNPALQDPHGPAAISWATVREHLRQRRGLLDAVVFSGGEPTRQSALVSAMAEVRELGMKVGLHSAGAYPARLAAALPHVDWLGLDIKAMPDRYASVVGIEIGGRRAWESLDIALAWGGDLEVRVTVDPTSHTRDHVLQILEELQRRGAPAPVLQEARDTGTSGDYAERLDGRRMLDVLRRQDLAGLQVR